MVTMTARPTIYDVAREAGVSASTVSRAYARPGRVNSETARQVFLAADRLGYRWDHLRGQPHGERATHGAIGLVIADVTNPFYGNIIKGAYEAAREAGLQLVLSHTNESPEVERETIEQELSHVDGVIIASSRMTDSALRMMAKQKPLVLLNRIIPEVTCVVSDHRRGIRRATEYLRNLGHERIHYVAGPETSWSDGVRWRALREAGAELAVDVRRVGPNEPTLLAGIGAARQVLRNDATAVLAFNDQVAIGVMKGLSKLGVTVPDDVSVVGIDNIIFDELVEPTLTTIAVPLYRMGFTGVQNCIAVGHGARPSGTPLVLPVRLVVRQSAGQRRRKRTSPARGTTKVSRSAS